MGIVTQRRILAAAVVLVVVAAIVAVVLVGRRPAGPRSFAAAIAYTRTPPAFEARRLVRVASEDELRRAVAELRAGDEVVATRAFDVDGEFILTRRLATPGALLRLGSGARAVRFAYRGPESLPAVWIHDTANVTLLGGDATSPRGGSGILISGPTTHVTWWGLRIHDVGGSGLAMLPAGGPVDHVDVEGVVTRWGIHLVRDPHREKGTGVHAALLADVEGAVFDDNRVAIDASHGPGDAIEIGNPTAQGEIKRNVLILTAHDLDYRATRALAGNGLQLWGGVPVEADVPFLMTRNTEGRAVDANGVWPGVSMAGVHVEYGRAIACCRNPLLPRTESSVDPREAWDPRFGVDYGNVQTSG